MLRCMIALYSNFIAYFSIICSRYLYTFAPLISFCLSHRRRRFIWLFCCTHTHIFFCLSRHVYIRCRCTLFDPNTVFKCSAIKVHHYHLMGKPEQLCMFCIGLLYDKHCCLIRIHVEQQRSTDPYTIRFFSL